MKNDTKSTHALPTGLLRHLSVIAVIVVATLTASTALGQTKGDFPDAKTGDPTTPGGQIDVPEPTTGMLLLCGALYGMARRPEREAGYDPNSADVRLHL